MPEITVYPDSNQALANLTGTGITSPMNDGSMVLTTTGFTNPNNAHADEPDVYATAAPANHRMLGQLYFFSTLAAQIPDGSTINSAKVQVERKYSTTASGACSACATFTGLAAAGQPSGMIGTQTKDLPTPGSGEPTTDTIWEHIFTPTAEQLRDSNFNVAVYCDRASLTGYTASFDFVRLVIDFTPPAGGGGGSASWRRGGINRNGMLRGM